MARMLRRAATVAAALLLGGCAAASPRSDRPEPTTFLDASAPTDARGLVRPEQIFDE